VSKNPELQKCAERKAIATRMGNGGAYRAVDSDRDRRQVVEWMLTASC